MNLEHCTKQVKKASKTGLNRPKTQLFDHNRIGSFVSGPVDFDAGEMHENRLNQHKNGPKTRFLMS